MDLHDLENTPPWEWPADARNLLLLTLREESASERDRGLAAELAGDLVVMNDELAAALLAIAENPQQPPDIRAKAAIALGPALEQSDIDGFEDIEGFEDDDDRPISEGAFHRIRESLRRIYLDGSTPKEVRRRVLEASVRAPERWHGDAARAAFAGDDQEWKLTAVFCMQFLKGFDEQILEALNSTDPDIHYHAVVAAGNWELEDAWPHVARLLASKSTGKPLLLAAIEAAAAIRPDEAPDVLDRFLASDDEEIVEAVQEALAIANDASEDGEWEDDDEDE